jgi:hypothetical protein
MVRVDTQSGRQKLVKSGSYFTRVAGMASFAADQLWMISDGMPFSPGALLTIRTGDGREDVVLEGGLLRRPCAIVRTW